MTEVAAETETVVEVVREVTVHVAEVHQLIHLYVNILDQGPDPDLARTTRMLHRVRISTSMIKKNKNNQNKFKLKSSFFLIFKALTYNYVL